MHGKELTFNHLVIIMLVAIAGVATDCFATVRVRRVTISGAVSTIDITSHTDPVGIVLGNTDARINVFAVPSSENLPRIDVTGNGTNPVTFIVGTDLNTAPTTVPLGSPAAANWAGMTCSRSNVVFNGYITGNLTGGVAASKFFRLDVGGTVLSSVQCGVNATDTESACWVVAGSFGAGTNIRAMAGNVGLVRSLNGSFQGTIESSNGAIRDILIAGDIGTSASPATITSAQGIDSISAGNVYASIAAGAGGTPAGRRVAPTDRDGPCHRPWLCTVGVLPVQDHRPPRAAVGGTGPLAAPAAGAAAGCMV